MRPTGRPSNRRTGGTPKYQLIREKLRQKILDGTYPAGSQLPPDTKLHKSLRVNKLTAIRALNDLVREGLLVRRQGSGSFVADKVQRPLFPGKHFKVGLLWKIAITPRELVESFEGQITSGILRILGVDQVQPVWTKPTQGGGTRVEWSSSVRGVSVVAMGESLESSVRHPPIKEVVEARCDGLIAVSVIETSFLDQIVALNIPTVFADHLNERYGSQADQVFVDPLAAYRDAVRYLIGQGLKRIHFLAGFTAIPAPSADMSREEVAAFRRGRMQVDPDSILRMSAWRQGLQECGISAPESWVRYENPWLVRDAMLAEKLWAMPEDQRPEAVVCHSIGQAEALIKLFAEHGLRLWAVGATSNTHAGVAMPIRAHGDEVGAASAEMLISRILRPDRLRLRIGVPMIFEATDATNVQAHASPAPMIFP